MSELVWAKMGNLILDWSEFTFLSARIPDSVWLEQLEVKIIGKMKS